MTPSVQQLIAITQKEKGTMMAGPRVIPSREDGEESPTEKGIPPHRYAQGRNDTKAPRKVTR
jgi:hypothetical protein